MSTPTPTIGAPKTETPPQAPLPAADTGAQKAVVVVLGAKLTPRGTAGPALVRRLTTARTLADSPEAAGGPVIVSGGLVGAVVTEASVMARHLRAAGLAAGRVVEEGRSRNTFENALFSLALVRRRDARRVLLVTDRAHMLRAWLCFAALAGPDLEVIARPAPGPRGLGAVIAAGRELGAVILYAPRLIRGWWRCRHPRSR